MGKVALAMDNVWPGLSFFVHTAQATSVDQQGMYDGGQHHSIVHPAGLIQRQLHFLPCHHLFLETNQSATCRLVPEQCSLCSCRCRPSALGWSL